ncbi:MAG: hypothetical protein K9H64_11930 [Bacteroidales bacterium]|nr:hypothetical protein [Bacteroidales bacterium]MCF8456751.1 hypothetical protein [Bacteroidales bacterium]
MKKMRVLITVMMMITSLSLVAQNEKSLIAEFKTADEVLVSKDGKTSSNFTVTIDKKGLEEMQRKAEDFGTSMRLSVTPDKEQNDKYSMSLQFDHEAQYAEIYKIVLYFGFSGVKINTEEFALDHLLNIKK